MLTAPEDRIDRVPAADVRRWAQNMSAPGAAVVLDVETTDLDGAVIEIAVIDAATGEVLIDTLIDPGPVHIAADAAAVHGISHLDLVGAPRWSEVASDVCAAVGDRVILAYNADFDHGRIAADCLRSDVYTVGRLTDRAQWQCVMAARCAAAGTRLRLAGGHRALSDARAAREVLFQLAAGWPAA